MVKKTMKYYIFVTFLTFPSVFAKQMSLLKLQNPGQKLPQGEYLAKMKKHLCQTKLWKNYGLTMTRLMTEKKF